MQSASIDLINAPKGCRTPSSGFRLSFAVTVCLLLQLFALQTRGQIISFNHITQEQGLRNGNVRCVVRDYQGFVWIGTEDEITAHAR